MKLVLFVNPYATHGVPCNAARGVISKLAAMSRALREDGFHLTLLTSKVSAELMIKSDSDIFEDVNKVIAFSVDDMLYLEGDDASSGSSLLCSSEIDKDYVARFQSLIRKSGGDLTPDFLISFYTETEVLKSVYPDSIVLFFETGLVSHAPFKEFHTLDRFGTYFSNPLFAMLARDEIEDDDLDGYDCIRDRIKSAANDCFDKVGQRLLHAYGEVSGFEKKVLLPLQVNGNASFDAAVGFKSQFDMVEYVLLRTPTNVAVLVTEHPRFSQLDEEQDNYLRENYRHYMYSADSHLSLNPSFSLLSQVDAVISVSSTVIFQSMIIEKPVFILGSGAFKVFNKAASLSEFVSGLLDGTTGTVSARVSNYLISRYSVPAQLYLTGWLPEYLRKIKESKGYDLPEILSAQRLLEYYEYDSSSIEREKGNELSARYGYATITEHELNKLWKMVEEYRTRNLPILFVKRLLSKLKRSHT